MLPAPQFRLLKPFAALASPGLVGVDIGTRLIKLAQIERRGGEYRFAARWAIGSDDAPALDAKSLAPGLAQRAPEIAAARSLFAGCAAAATLSMSHVEMRSLELPCAPPDELREMAWQELAAEADSAPETYECDAWQAAASDETAQVISLAAGQELCSQVGESLLQAGLECAVLDGLPCALARAVGLCDPGAREAVAALDLGETSPMVVVVDRGRPAFCRILRNRGLEGLNKRMQDKLQLSRGECRHLLTHLGLPAQRGSGMSAAIAELITAELDLLVDELRRTLQFVGQQSPGLAPKKLWILGRGGTIRNLPAALERKLGLPTLPWRLSPVEDRAAASDPLFAAAAGLSALRWEAALCT